VEVYARTRTLGSSEGDRIAFTSDGAHETGEIYAMNADGSGLTRLTDDPAYDPSPPGGRERADPPDRTEKDG
jgi:Tol biopolymer transport system component